MHIVKKQEVKTYNERFITKTTSEISKEFGFNIIQQRALTDVLYRCTRNVEIYLTQDEEGDFSTFIDIYINSMKLEGLSDLTIKHKAYTLRELNRYVDKKIENVTLADLKMFILYKQGKCKASTLNGIIV
ncbi:hypothetical protein, partial [Intestinibacter sp.]|uniref:hypothetical protein n=1 Tax=Intestinibacter sp. TaxID=1965304 RepID=UPI002A78A375|nr:hypothetical protein [Intestinibacter sp.]